MLEAVTWVVLGGAAIAHSDDKTMVEVLPPHESPAVMGMSDATMLAETQKEDIVEQLRILVQQGCVWFIIFFL